MKQEKKVFRVSKTSERRRRSPYLDTIETTVHQKNVSLWLNIGQNWETLAYQSVLKKWGEYEFECRKKRRTEQVRTARL